MPQRIIVARPDGGLSVIIPAPGFTVADCMKDVPADAVAHEVVNATDIPADRTFRAAWFHDTTPAPQKVGVHITKAKEISHEMRRAKREKELAPFDEIIMKQIPGKSAKNAEDARAVIRSKHDVIQIQIDSCTTPEALKAIIIAEGL